MKIIPFSPNVEVTCKQVGGYVLMYGENHNGTYKAGIGRINTHTENFADCTLVASQDNLPQEIDAMEWLLKMDDERPWEKH